MKTNQVELLAPAGNMAALHAAVAGGADAVYLGLETFNARRGADNFTLETLREACDFAHLRGVSVYVTMNTIILPDEVGEALGMRAPGLPRRSRRLHRTGHRPGCGDLPHAPRSVAAPFHADEHPQPCRRARGGPA